MKKIIFFLTFFVLGITSTFAFDASDNFSFTHSGSTYDVFFYPANNGNQYGATFDVKKDGSSYKGASGTRFHTDNSNHIIALPTLSGYNFLGCYGVQQYYYNSTIWNGGYTWGYCPDKYIIKDNIFYAISGTIGGPYHISFTYDLSTYTTTYNGGSGAGASNEVINYGLVTDYSELFDIPNEVFFPTNISSGNQVCEVKSFQTHDYFPSAVYTYPNDNSLIGDFSLFEGGNFGVGFSNDILGEVEGLQFFSGENPEILSASGVLLTEADFNNALTSENGMTFNFDNYDLPWKDNPILHIERPSGINYLKIVGTGSTQMTLGTTVDTATREINFGELITFEDGFSQYFIVFNKQNPGSISFDPIEVSIDFIDFGFVETFNHTQEVCDTGSGIEIDGTTYTYDEIDLEALENGGVINSFYETVNNDFSPIPEDSLSSIIGEEYLDSLKDSFSSGASIEGDLGEFDGSTLVVIDGNKKTCEVFNEDGSFQHYSNGTFSLSFQFLPESGFWRTILFPAQWLVDLFTQPLNNVISLFRTMGTFPDGTQVCFLGFIYEIEYQSLFPEESDPTNSFYGGLGDYAVYKGEMTFLDYVFILIFGLIIIPILVKILLRN